jgi:hypothetical protein
LIGLLKKSRDLIQVSFAALVIVALITIVALKSGGPAARVLFHSGAQGVTRESIHLHAEAAEGAFKGMCILGAAALIGFFLTLRSGGPPTFLTLLILLGSLAVSVGLARVAHLGGLIRHPEIDASAPSPAMMMMSGPPPTKQ